MSAFTDDEYQDDQFAKLQSALYRFEADLIQLVAGKRLLKRPMRDERPFSFPDQQFICQLQEEINRIRQEHYILSTDPKVLARVSDVAYANIKKQWEEQGIWNNKWPYIPTGRWKHEEPLDIESDIMKDLEPERPLFGIWRPLSDEEKEKKLSEERAKRVRDREASRPYHQFIYQVSKAREQIEKKSSGVTGRGLSVSNINTTAYGNVRNVWMERKIWNKDWGILPGMSWQHEKPNEAAKATDIPAPLPNTIKVRFAGSHDPPPGPGQNLFGGPPAAAQPGIFSLFGASTSGEVGGANETSKDPATIFPAAKNELPNLWSRYDPSRIQVLGPPPGRHAFGLVPVNDPERKARGGKNDAEV